MTTPALTIASLRACCPSATMQPGCLLVVLVIVLIAVQTFIVTQVGLRLGNRLSERIRERAERLAGVALTTLGLVLLAEKLLA